MVLPLYFLVPSAGEGWQRNLANVLGTLFLAPVPPKPIIGVAWSLLLEVIFYAAFALAIVWRRWGMLVVAGWLLIAALHPAGWFEGDYVVSEFLSRSYTAFGVGMVIAALRPLLPGRFGVIAIWAGATLQGAAAYIAAMLGADNVHRPLWMDYAIWIGAGLVVAGLVTPERSGGARGVGPSWLIHIGNASYSIYLVHWLVGWAGEKLLIKLLGADRLDFFVALAIIVAAMLAVSLLVYRYVEQPFGRLAARYASTRLRHS